MSREVEKKLKGGLIVSCQAGKEEPLFSSYIMARMAYAAYEGGAVGIRANSVSDIMAIKKTVQIPIIGIVKKEYEDSLVYITPTMKEVDELVSCGVDIIAMDFTKRMRPKGKSLNEFYIEVRKKYPEQLLMADCSNYEEGIHAARLGVNFIGTTLNGYTDYTKDSRIPNLDFLKQLVEGVGTPVIAEGGIWSPKQLKDVFSIGAFAAVVGTAITRPKDITKHFIKNSGCRQRTTGT